MVNLDIALSLELAFYIIFKTFIKLQPQEDDTCQYSISYSYFETMLSLIQNIPLIEEEVPLD